MIVGLWGYLAIISYGGRLEEFSTIKLVYFPA
jgi:hypothetical protein